KPDIFERAGFSAYVQKPFLPEELLNQVSIVLNGKENQLQQIKTETISGEFYTIDALKAFASDDPETTRDILISFVASTEQNVSLFKQHLRNEDFEALSLLAHKMLPLFKQLGAKSVSLPLTLLEQKKFELKDNKNWVETGETVLKNVAKLLGKIK